VNILAGLDSTQDSSAVNGIPGLVNIPFLGKFLFGSNHTEKDSQQLMIALVPHIIRTPDYTAENLRGVFSGPDQALRMMYAPRDDEGSGSGVPAGGAANPAPATAPQTPIALPPVPGAAPNAAPNAAPPPVPPAAGTRIVFLPGSVSVGPNTPFTVNVELNGAADAFAITPLRVKWDPAVLRLTDITPGDLLSRSGGTVSSIKDVRNDAGEATLNVSRAAGGTGVSGSGPVAILNFVAVARGNGAVTITEMGLKNPQLQPLPVALGSVSVAVQ
jgi:hypothetical protein